MPENAEMIVAALNGCANITRLPDVKRAVMNSLDCQVGSLEIRGKGPFAIAGHTVQILQDGKPIPGLRRLTLVVDVEEAVVMYLEQYPSGLVCGDDKGTGRSLMEQAHAPPKHPNRPLKGVPGEGWNIVYLDMPDPGYVELPGRSASLSDVVRVLEQNKKAAQVMCPHGEEVGIYEPVSDTLHLSIHAFEVHLREVEESRVSAQASERAEELLRQEAEKDNTNPDVVI